MKNKKEVFLGIVFYMTSGIVIPSVFFVVLSLVAGINLIMLVFLFFFIIPTISFLLLLSFAERTNDSVGSIIFSIILILISLYGILGISSFMISGSRFWMTYN